MDWSRSIAWFSFVYNFHHVSRVAISSVVFDNLSSAIRKVNLVFSVGGIAITGFLLAKIDSGVVILNCVLILVFWRSVIDWLMV